MAQARTVAAIAATAEAPLECLGSGLPDSQSKSPLRFCPLQSDWSQQHPGPNPAKRCLKPRSAWHSDRGQAAPYPSPPEDKENGTFDFCGLVLINRLAFRPGSESSD